MSRVHVDRSIGISVDKVYWVYSKKREVFWCRMPIPIIETDNLEKSRALSPFDPKFSDNYVEGKGESKKEALERMQKLI